MTTKVLLTHHHRDAMENAADRGFWMPLPLPVEEGSLDELMYLTAVSYGSGQIRALLQIESFEPWRERMASSVGCRSLAAGLPCPVPCPSAIAARWRVGCRVNGRRCRSSLSMPCLPPSGSVMCCQVPAPVAICRRESRL